MPSLTMIIVWLAIAGIMIMFGMVLTVRHYVPPQQDHAWMNGTTKNKTVAQCFYCEGMTTHYIGVMHDGYTYNPVCIDCQYRTGIRCADGSISADFVYQVEQYGS